MSLLLSSFLLTAALTPLNDLGAQEFRWGLIGGLWADGSNSMPAAHAEAGLRHAAKVVPRDAAGKPSPNGKIAFLSIGSVNTALTFDAMMKMAAESGRVAPNVVMLNAAVPGVGGSQWGAPWDAIYNRTRKQVLQPAGLTELQVQAVWLQLATEYPTTPLPIQTADAYVLKGWYAEALRALKEHYPNLAVAYLSSREYAGYATQSTWNPEPFAYESGFSVRWAILGQVAYMRDGGFWDTRVGILNYDRNAPWITWGPYFWADGENARADGLRWLRDDFTATGDVLSEQGAQKTGELLYRFLLREPTATWFRNGEEPPPEAPSSPRKRAVRH